MPRPRRIDPELVAQARMVVVDTCDVKQLRAAQSILLPALAHATLEQTAALLWVGRASVPRLQRRFRKGLQPTPSDSPVGWPQAGHDDGRRGKSISFPWAEQARDAGVLVVSPVRAALAEKLGRTHGATSAMLGAGAPAAGDRQWLRAPVRLRLRRGGPLEDRLDWRCAAR